MDKYGWMLKSMCAIPDLSSSVDTGGNKNSIGYLKLFEINPSFIWGIPFYDT